MKRVQYDGPGASLAQDCRIEIADAGKMCELSVTLDEDMDGPIHVFYEISNFYQNHRSYVKSMSWDQLHKRNEEASRRVEGGRSFAPRAPSFRVCLHGRRIVGAR